MSRSFRICVLLALIAIVKISAFSLHMGGSSGVATTRAGKQATVDSVRELLDTTNFIYGVRVEGIKSKELVDFRKTLPEDVTLRVVKNRLLRKAAEGTSWEALVPITTESNAWFFVQGEDFRGAVKAWTDFVKGSPKDEANPIFGGCFEGECLDESGVDKVAKLPTKIELITRVGKGIRMVPTKIGKGLRLVPTKLGKGIKLAYDVPDADKDEAAEDSA